MRVYLSGGMSGIPNHNREAFDVAAASLRNAGNEVVSPAEETLHRFGNWAAAEAAPYRVHLVHDLDIIAGSAPASDGKSGVDAVALLPGWELSTGSRMEVSWALTLGLPVLDLDLKPVDVLVTHRSPSHGRPFYYECSVPGCALDGHKRETRRESFDVEVTDFTDGSRAYLRTVDGTEGGEGLSDMPDGVVADPSGALKADAGKPDLSLLSYKANYATAEVLTFGALKYDAHNWRRGFRWGRTFAALQRHLGAWNDGEDNDPETGKSHLAHARCNLDFLLEFVLTGTGVDDRYKREPAEELADRKERDPITGRLRMEGRS